MRLTAAVPALPCRDVVAAAKYYTTRFGFTLVHSDDEFAVLVRDDVRLHLWRAGDERWRQRGAADLAETPVRSGAESFLAGTASCRIEVDGVAAVDELYAELAAAGVLHPTDRGSAVDTSYGTRELAALDLDGNLLEFFCWRDS
ncbi:VOC family protein [Nocardioides sp. SYSU D00038]|uniref:VOC family protein n=1 Tax=Nocardioides sp. SYSU D00038 TaxID=2812554 RepID=UPI001968A086|nr:VOC family protein [Nocardioides sp. SYSU D00038]